MEKHKREPGGVLRLVCFWTQNSPTDNKVVRRREFLVGLEGMVRRRYEAG